MRNYLNVRNVMFLVIAVGFLVFVGYLKIEAYKKNQFFAQINRTQVLAPLSVPSINQNNIDVAMKIFAIDKPKLGKHPILNNSLKDRGMSSKGAWDKKVSVEIGPSAFTSWALLGSTLAHEIEVHCNQNFVLINIFDLLGLDGTGEAERQAYSYELSQAKRFGTSIADKKLIATTMKYYYPENIKKGKPKFAFFLKNNIGKWFSKHLINY